MVFNRLPSYFFLLRLNKPIGILLLLWPTLWALWLAYRGLPARNILFIFMAGVLVMRSAGCVMNDLADRHIDPHVARTRYRPLASKKIKPIEAIILLLILSAFALWLVSFCNRLTTELAFFGASITVLYPFLKRWTHLPQLGLGVAFGWSIPMVYAAAFNTIPPSAWLVFVIAVLWPIIYDTMYAMVDRQDDLKIGVKSTAILFGRADKFILALLQMLFLFLLLLMGYVFKLTTIYYLALILAAILCVYQQWLIKERNPARCFRAFLNNNWVGFIIFIGIVGSFYR